MTAPFDRAAAERRLGSAAVQAIREQVAAAPPMSAETRMHVQAAFASVNTTPAETLPAAA